MIIISILLLVAWSYVCYVSGQIIEVQRRLSDLRQRDAADMDARDQWANDYVNRNGVNL